MELSQTFKITDKIIRFSGHLSSEIILEVTYEISVITYPLVPTVGASSKSLMTKELEEGEACMPAICMPQSIIYSNSSRHTVVCRAAQENGARKWSEYVLTGRIKSQFSRIAT